MNNCLRISLSIIFLLALSTVAFAGKVSKGGGINWVKYDKALELAKKTNKHVLVDFATAWCGYCKKMDATTYKDTQVVAAIAKDFVAAVVDGDSYDVLKLKDGDLTEKGLTLQYGVRGYPTTWFLEPDGGKIAPVPGYVDARQFFYILDYVRSNSNEKMSFKEFVEGQTLKAGSK